MDGSAVEFCGLIQGAGIAEQDGTVEEIVVDEPIEVSKDDGEQIRIEAADGFSIT